MTKPKDYSAAERLARRLFAHRVHRYEWTVKSQATRNRTAKTSTGPIVRLKGLTNLHKLLA